MEFFLSFFSIFLFSELYSKLITYDELTFLWFIGNTSHIHTSSRSSCKMISASISTRLSSDWPKSSSMGLMEILMKYTHTSVRYMMRSIIHSCLRRWNSRQKLENSSRYSQLPYSIDLSLNKNRLSIRISHSHNILWNYHTYFSFSYSWLYLS